MRRFNPCLKAEDFSPVRLKYGDSNTNLTNGAGFWVASTNLYWNEDEQKLHFRYLKRSQEVECTSQKHPQAVQG